MMNKTVLMLSVSCMSFIAGADLCYAGFNPYDTPPVLNAAMLKSHVSTHTSHLTAAHLSSLEDFAELTLSESSGLSLPKNLGNSVFYSLPKNLGNSVFYSLPENSGRAREGFTIPPSPALNRATSPLKGEGDRIKLAAACFVTDTTDCSGNEFGGNNADDNDGGVPPGGDDYNLDNDKRCIEEGYLLTSCPEGYEPYNYCPYDSNYFEKCVPSCPNDYVTCEKPYYGVGEACDGKYASCECTPCGSGYDNTTIPDGYVQDGEACLDCDGKTKYKIKPNPCDGFMDCGSMGPEAGANSCLSGTTTKYDNCKPCPNLGSLTSCPAPFTCTYEECSNRYYKSGCQSDYDWNASSQTCTVQCPNNYQYTCTPNSDPYLQGGSGEACNGKYTTCSCTSGYYWNGTKCATCVNKLEDGWTYNGDSCPYGYLTYESINDPSQCYHAKYKCNSCNNCQPGQFLIAGSQYNGSQTYKCSNTPPAPSIPGWGYTYSDDDIIIMIESTNSQLCQYNIYSLREIETTNQCEYYPHDEKILKIIKF